MVDEGVEGSDHIPQKSESRTLAEVSPTESALLMCAAWSDFQSDCRVALFLRRRLGELSIEKPQIDLGYATTCDTFWLAGGRPPAHRSNVWTKLGPKLWTKLTKSFLWVWGRV